MYIEMTQILELTLSQEYKSIYLLKKKRSITSNKINTPYQKKKTKLTLSKKYFKQN